MSTGSKKRYEHIDYTKGFGILLIMLAHVIQNFGPMQGVNSFVRSFHVPVFFIASGYLFFYRYFEVTMDVNLTGIEKFIKKRAKALLIPYVIFSIFNSVLKFAVLFLTGGLSKEGIKEELVQLFITGNGTVWFLMTLFLTECAVLIFFKTANKIAKPESNSILIMTAVTMVVLLIIPFLIKDVKAPLMIVLVRLIAGVGYYLLGIIFGWIFSTTDIVKKAFTGVILLILGAGAFKFLGCEIDFFNGQFSKAPGSLISSICLSFSSIILLYNLEQKITANIQPKNVILASISKILNYFGKNSIIAMLVHPTVLLCMTFPFGGWMSSQIGVKAVIISILIFVILAILQIPFIFIIDRYLPFLIGKNRRDNKEVQ